MQAEKIEIELTWMPVYWEKLLAGTTHMDAAEFGGYILLIAEQWKKGFVPGDEKKLMKIARQRSKEKLATILEKFNPDGCGNLINKVCAEIRLDQLAKYAKNKISGKKGAEKRWRKDSERHTDAKVSAIAEERSKKKEDTNVSNHQQHAHEEFSKKFFTEEGEKDRVDIQMQLSPSRLIHELEVRKFNAFLRTEKKVHETFHEWIKHLRNWLNTKPKEKTFDKKENNTNGKSENQQDTKLGRNSRKDVADYLRKFEDTGDSEQDSESPIIKVA